MKVIDFRLGLRTLFNIVIVLIFVQSTEGQRKSYEIIDNDSIKVYFDYLGHPTSITTYEFCRYGRLNSQGNEFQGIIKDFDIHGKSVFQGFVINGVLEGKALFFYENEKIKIQGFYSNNRRSGIWTYYYRNGQIRMKIKYADEEYLLEYYKRSGKQLVQNGNGSIKYSSSAYIANIKGEVKNGLRSGVWKNSKFEEHYDAEGRFIKGYNKNVKKPYYETIFLYSYPIPNEYSKIGYRIAE